MDWLKKQIRAAWQFSRTIFLNVASILALASTELVAYALNVNWASVINNPNVLFGIALSLNVANIYLRTQTKAAVGKKPVEGG